MVASILAALDATPRAADCARLARALADQLGCPLHLLHATPDQTELASEVVAAAGEARAARRGDPPRRWLLAMATHGRTGLARVVMGSVTTAAVRTSPSPVLKFRPPHLDVG